MWIFSACAPQLSRRILFAPPGARAIFLHSDLLCNSTCSVTGWRITYWGGTKGKDPFMFINESKGRTLGFRMKHNSQRRIRLLPLADLNYCSKQRSFVSHWGRSHRHDVASRFLVWKTQICELKFFHRLLLSTNWLSVICLVKEEEF